MSDEDYEHFDGWDSGATEAEVELSNLSAIDSDGSFIHLGLLSATAESFVYTGLPSARLECDIRVEFNFGSGNNGVLTSGSIIYDPSATSSATLQVDGASPLDILDVRINVRGGADAWGGGLDRGAFGFEYEGTYFDAVVRGYATEEATSYEYYFDEVDNTMDFYFDGVAVTDPAMEGTFYVELPSGSQIDVACYATAYGSSLEYSADSSNSGNLGELVVSYAHVNVDILP